jgi:hypothetical protein
MSWRDDVNYSLCSKLQMTFDEDAPNVVSMLINIKLLRAFHFPVRFGGLQLNQETVMNVRTEMTPSPIFPCCLPKQAQFFT